MSQTTSRRRVAVIGSGVSGLTAAYILRNDNDVTVFESDDRIGGHAHTHTVADLDATHRVDSGFIVHNDRTYPLLRRLFAELDVDVHATEMSMSIHCDGARRVRCVPVPNAAIPVMNTERRPSLSARRPAGTSTAPNTTV